MKEFKDGDIIVAGKTLFEVLRPRKMAPAIETEHAKHVAHCAKCQWDRQMLGKLYMERMERLVKAGPNAETEDSVPINEDDWITANTPKPKPETPIPETGK